MAGKSDLPPNFARRLPDGDTHERLVCETCGWIHYDNPRIIVGAVCAWQSCVLLCRRAIPPRAGYWTIPAGFLELHETADAGARREAWEEAGADIETTALLAIYHIPRISQIQLIYTARLRNADIAAGVESSEVALVTWGNIPWDELAFPSVRWALEQYRQVAGRTDFQPFTNPPGEWGERGPDDRG